MVVTFVTSLTLSAKLAIMAFEQVNWISNFAVPWINEVLSSQWFVFFYYITLELVPMCFLIMLCWQTHFTSSDKQSQQQQHNHHDWTDSHHRSSYRNNSESHDIHPKKSTPATISHAENSDSSDKGSFEWLTHGLFLNCSNSQFEENVVNQVKEEKKKRKRSNGTNTSITIVATEEQEQQ